jgi:hypothetical protein
VPHRARSLVFVIAGSALACGSGAALRPRPPTYAPAGETKTRSVTTTSRPLIVEWPSADRAALEARLRRGLVLVRYEGGAMEVLDRCVGPGAYEYTPVTRKRDRIAIHDEHELETEIPLGAAHLGAKLASSGQLEVTTTIVGRHEATRVSVASQELTGDCSRVTHVLAAVTVGAFRLSAGGQGSARANASAFGAHAGGHAASSEEVLDEDGNDAACGSADGNDKKPPQDCGAPLRVEVVPVGCPKGTQYEPQRGCVVGSSPSPAATIAATPRARLVGPCNAAMSSAGASQASCGDGTTPWCDGGLRRVACCAEGLVPSGEEGACACPPGGSDKASLAAHCSKAIAEPTRAEEVIAGTRGAMRRCFDEGRTRDASLAGRVLLTLVVSPTGDVYRATITESTLSDPEVQACLLQTFRTTAFPVPVNGSSTLHIPVVFAR